MRILERERKSFSDIQGRVRSRRLAKLRLGMPGGWPLQAGIRTPALGPNEQEMGEGGQNKSHLVDPVREVRQH